MPRRTPIRLRAALVAVAVLATAAVLGACGSSSETVSSRLVSQAVSTTSNGGSFRIAITGSFRIPQLGKPVPRLDMTAMATGVARVPLDLVSYQGSLEKLADTITA